MQDLDPEETREWEQSLEEVIAVDGKERAKFLMDTLQTKFMLAPASRSGSEFINSDYLNSILPEEEPEYPGNLDRERRICSLTRWNAMAMVLRANKRSDGIGGHIATYASCASLYEVAYNHIFKGPKDDFLGDAIFFQGHASPGIYARAFLEGLLEEKQLENFRRELSKGGGLSSYPHPRLMPEFWQFPTVSMGLGPLMAIYLARFNKSLEHRGLKSNTLAKVFAYVGDGETDEVETRGALSLAVRGELNNLIFVINCNLQRLDGPVRGNGKIIQELEGVFKGAGWNVIKVIWDSRWDVLFKKDRSGKLLRLVEESLDGDFQLFSTLNGSERRKIFFSKYPEVKELVSDLSDEELENLNFGGHDEKKIYAAYKKALNYGNSRPTVILFKTIKGFGMGKSAEGRNIAHQKKNMSLDALKAFKKRFHIPIADKDLAETPFIKFPADSEEARYLLDVRKRQGAFLPYRKKELERIPLPQDAMYAKIYQNTEKRNISTTMAFVRVLTGLLQTKGLGERIFAIVPDESRTFGMEALFRPHGIYSSKGQLYAPVDKNTLVPYIESKQGKILQEGINEAGASSEFIASGTSYSHQGMTTVPFYVFYSMFGFQRTGDLFWAAADMQVRGFLIGGTAGRTTLNGEGLQHEDGHSHIIAATIPNLRAYDPAYAYEVIAILKHGLRRMYEEDKDEFYYLTVYNENYEQLPMPKDIAHLEEKICKGIYLLKDYGKNKEAAGRKPINILASGISLNFALRAAKRLFKEHSVLPRVWSVTSFKALRDGAVATQRQNMLNPDKPPQLSFFEESIAAYSGPFVGVSDYMRLFPDMISPYINSKLFSIGTDGFGCSSSREELREHFEINEDFIIAQSLYALSQTSDFSKKEAAKAIKKMGININKKNPLNT